ncbi:MAG: hypothetical protein SOZ59_06690 [Candidatus Limivivens sp.]|nr:hypothetical protein [Candidatus Limivivens sp.]
MPNGATNKPGRPGHTFIVEIKNTQSQSWQGAVRWVETQKTQAFRSTLELIKLLDSAVSEGQERIKWE